MKNINMSVFYDALTDLIDVLEEKEIVNVRKAAEICAESIANDGVIHVFGSGHSVGFGIEMQGRAGSLVPIHSIDTSDFVLKGKFTLEEFKDPNNVFERRPGIADKLYELYEMKPSDAFIIISNSGINGVVIDMAIMAKERGHRVIVVTSWQHTTAEDSRHPSGKKLYEMGDVVIDNCGPQGDALLVTDGIEKVCSVSSITGAFIAQTICLETCQLLEDKQYPLPVLWAANKEGFEKHNADLLAHYRGRI